MPCCRSLEKVNSSGLELPWGKSQRCLMALTQSGRDGQNPVWVCVSREETQKYDKAGQTCSLCWDFWRFFCTSQRRGNSSVWLVFCGCAFQAFCVLPYGHLGPGSASFFLVPNEGQHCSSQATARAELGINPGDSWHSGIGILT